ncbi:hypothetical protein BT63DRAFT_463490 [Microthyrium microscopicum]|uniref:Metallo-beta-lactamase domain-containing protein n=1 Tax=Microthyrium microscopicum TaxID=703497 RepID=A0A6A6U443_9PEZI|nr:hypothetical protein BT63DRAFT_463490 [Microthyrium microscopicum]
MFDLGIRKDIEKLDPHTLGSIKIVGWDITRAGGGELLDIKDVLDQGGKGDIDAVIWSHWHFDHTGDMTRFPKNVDLVVGPGFKENKIPGYPTNPAAGISEDAWEGRTLRELDFAAAGLKIGGYEAVDYFGDGSFYLLSTPGHAIGHMSALARTTASPEESFVFLGGDIVHFNGGFRPTQQVPLPCSELDDDPRTTPFFKIADGPDGQRVAHNHANTQQSVDHMEIFDADDRILIIIAHDASLLDVIDEMFPKTLNGWKVKGWKQRGRWAFLPQMENKAGKLNIEVPKV